MATVHDDAICVRHWDWSETSQTVSLFTRDHGLVRALAKGSKRPKAPYSGGIELLTRAEASLILKPHSELALLTAWNLAETFAPLRRSLAAHRAGLFIAELLQVALTDRDPHPPLFVAAVEALRSLDDAAANTAALVRFQWTLLVETGYKPSLDGVSTGAPAGTLLFNPITGGIVAGDATHPVTTPSWPVRTETIDLLRSLDSGRPMQPPPGVAERASRLLAAYLRHVLGRDLLTAPAALGGELPR